MLVETCQIIAVNDQEMWLESRAKRDCSACAKGVGCGGGVLAKLTRQPVNQLVMPRDARVSTHQYWQVAIPEQLLMLGAVISYGLPLIFCLLVAISLPIILPGVDDIVVAIASFGCLFLGHVLARRYAARIDFSKQIQLLRPVEKPCLMQDQG